MSGYPGAANAAVARVLTPRRTAALRLSTVIVAVVLLEGSARVAFRILHGRLYTGGELVEQLRAAEQGTAASVLAVATHPRNEVIHPFLGFVMDPYSETADARRDRAFIREYSGLDVTDFGFIDAGSPIRARDPRTLVVGVFGGSVAHYVTADGGQALLDEIGKAPWAKGREVALVRLGMGGFKQPQQLMTLTYLLSLGAHFDVVINLDGYNEVVLPGAENVPKGVFPFFPRNWYHRTLAFPNRASTALRLRILDEHERRGRMASAILHTSGGYSATVGLLWTHWDRWHQARLHSIQERLAAEQPASTPYVASGPPRRYASEAELFGDLAGVWERSSVQMSRLCAANGARYFHFLQPNQYLPNSKPLHPDELRTNAEQGHPYRTGVEKGYPFLRARGARLPESGVFFRDLTDTFRDERAPMYIDMCCHLNKEGNTRLATRIGRIVAESTH